MTYGAKRKRDVRSPLIQDSTRSLANNARNPMEATRSSVVSKFSEAIRPHAQAELAAAVEARRRGDRNLAFRRLERAHVLSQSAPFEHVRAHAYMLAHAIRHRRVRDVFGQVLRMVLAAPLSMLGVIPVGNTGGSNVNGLRSMPVPADLQQIIDDARACGPG